MPAAPQRNFESRTLYHGDNLPFLRGMNSGTVDLIATDPPFNKSKDFHATPDSIASGARFVDRWSWDRDVHEEWVDAIKDDWPAAWSVIESTRIASGDDMGAFLCWLGVRLMEMHRVLTDDGSIYLHIDHTAHAYVKTLMDAIFGRKNFRNEIVWQRMSGTKSNAKRFFTQHDTLLYYVKSDNSVWNRELEPFTDEEVEASWFKYVDTDGRRYKVNDLTAPGRQGGHQYEFLGAVRRWRYPLDKMNELLAIGQIHHKSCTPGAGNDVAVRKRYLDEMDGRPLGSVWTNIKNLNRNNTERTGYPTQKPLALYERIIRASSNEGDLVLDPFCGCATTPVAAERLGREWVGIDIWDGAHQMVLDRLRDEKLAVPDAESGASRSLITFGSVTYSTTPPVRTDEGKTAAPTLNLKVQIPEPPGPKLTNAQMKAQLVERNGIVCAGCDRTFDDERYLQLDHNAPRSQGGLHHISNRLLLCGPCNLAKSNTLTLEGLRRHNRANGWMAKR